MQGSNTVMLLSRRVQREVEIAIRPIAKATAIIAVLFKVSLGLVIFKVSLGLLSLALLKILVTIYYMSITEVPY